MMSMGRAPLPSRAMHENSPLLVPFVTDPALGRVLKRAMRGGRLLLAASPSEFMNFLSQEEPNGILVDVSVSRREIEALVPASVARFPHVPILLCTPSDSPRSGYVVRMAQCFPTSVVVQGYEDVVREIGRLLRDELSLTVATALVLELAKAVPVEAQWIVRLCVVRATQRPTVTELSAIAGVSARTLDRRIGNACGMSPQALLTRSRLLFAAAILHVTRLSVAQAAETTGFADASSLSHSMKSISAGNAGNCESGGPFPCLCNRFAQGTRAGSPTDGGHDPHGGRFRQSVGRSGHGAARGPMLLVDLVQDRDTLAIDGVSASSVSAMAPIAGLIRLRS